MPRRRPSRRAPPSPGRWSSPSARSHCAPTRCVSTVSACIACRVAFRLAPEAIVVRGSRCMCTTCRSGNCGAQHVQIAQVRRRFEHPALCGLHAALPLLPLQELQHPVQVGVGGREILCVEPGPVGGRCAPDSGTCDRNASARKTISSSASRAYIGWIANSSGASSRDLASRASLIAMRGSAPAERRSPAWARPRRPPSRTRSASAGRRPAAAAAAWCRCASSRRRRSARRSARRGSPGAGGSTPGRAAASAGCARCPTAGCASPMALRSALGVVVQQHRQRSLEIPGAPVGEGFLALRVGQHRGQVEGLEVAHAVRTSGAG